MECSESENRVTRITLSKGVEWEGKTRYFGITHLTENNSRQNNTLMKRVEPGPKALRPISVYVRNLGSDMMIRASSFALESDLSESRAKTRRKTHV